MSKLQLAHLKTKRTELPQCVDFVEVGARFDDPAADEKEARREARAIIDGREKLTKGLGLDHVLAKFVRARLRVGPREVRALI